MRHSLVVIILSALALATVPTVARAEYPKPSIYPIAWQLKFTHGLPKRISVAVPGNPIPQAFWYMTYTVTNKTGSERMFLPCFELLSEDGKVLRSDKNIPVQAFDLIKKLEGQTFMVNAIQVSGEIRLGEDESKTSVAIWPETNPRMGSFSIFVAGLSGEAVTLKESNVILHKTLQLNYLIRGDEVYPGEDEVNENPESWVMR